MNIFGKVWNWFTKSKAVLEIETIAINAVASELEAICDKFLGDGTPLDKAMDKLIEELATKIIAALPASEVKTIAAQPKPVGPQP